MIPPSTSRPPDLSIVIPTRDRRAVLARTLHALDAQVEAPPFEVVVVDDGSGDDTLAFLDQRRGRTPVVVLPQAPLGPAAARNRGIERARAARVLLLGDDTWPDPRTVARHAHPEAGETIGLQGRIDWDPSIGITPLMRFLAPAGPQFYFRGLRDGEPIPYTAVLGSNLSAPTAWFRDEPYDEGFPHASFEDTEQAFRWQRRGWRVSWSEAARCWHHHRYDDLTAFLDRQVRAGRAARYAVRRHPALWWRTMAQPTVVGGGIQLVHWLARSVTGQPTVTQRWDLACRRAFLRGVLRGDRS